MRQKGDAGTTRVGVEGNNFYKEYLPKERKGGGGQKERDEFQRGGSKGYKAPRGSIKKGTRGRRERRPYLGKKKKLGRCAKKGGRPTRGRTVNSGR